ncbi:hypothetical protein [Roseateles sp. LYH14W]|uniref:Siroheme decarboxylase NirL-like HTH domain-containing protein n=1 Tax=Pelomonas parva TaxID=3299032 RepID=A0ABW7EX59_9BURK
MVARLAGFVTCERHTIDIAAGLEHGEGLPLCSRPYAACARPPGCSEQRVLTHLNAWRRSGQLEGLTLKPPPTPVPRPGLLALWRQVALPAALPARLLALPGMDRVVPGPGSPAWPWRLSVVMCTAPLRDAAPWRERLAEAGLAAPPDACLPLRIEQPRDQALLFDTGDAQGGG